jgi:hypothetical protein
VGDGLAEGEAVLEGRARADPHDPVGAAEVVHVEARIGVFARLCAPHPDGIGEGLTLGDDDGGAQAEGEHR